MVYYSIDAEPASGEMWERFIKAVRYEGQFNSRDRKELYTAFSEIDSRAAVIVVSFVEGYGFSGSFRSWYEFVGTVLSEYEGSLIGRVADSALLTHAKNYAQHDLGCCDELLNFVDLNQLANKLCHDDELITVADVTNSRVHLVFSAYEFQY